MKTTLPVWALTSALALSGILANATNATAGSENQQTIGFGVLPVNQPEAMEKRFQPLIAYLEKETGYDFVLKTYPTSGESGGYTAAVRGLLSGDTPFAYLAPVTIAQARHHDQAVEPLVCAVRGGSPTYVGEIAVRSDADIQRPEDLVGHRVIGASPSSTSGNLLPSGMLIEKGIDKSSFAAMDFAGGHDKAAQAVLDGRYDAAWINDKNFQKFKHQGAGLRAIWVHDPVPEFPITVNTRYVRPEVLAKIRSALLEMDVKDLAAIQAIDPKYESWVPITWEDYAPVKRTIDAVHGVEFYDLKD
jgi:phosphate/phosphite/phosphonate ABC transporter binding protein